MEDILEFSRRQRGAEQACLDVTNLVIDKALAKCYENYMKRRVVPFAVERAREDIVEMIEWVFLGTDHGEVNHDKQVWVSDTQPDPSPIDNWSRGVIPSRPKPKTPPVLKKETASGNEIDKTGKNMNAKKKIAGKISKPTVSSSGTAADVSKSSRAGVMRGKGRIYSSGKDSTSNAGNRRSRNAIATGKEKTIARKGAQDSNTDNSKATLMKKSRLNTSKSSTKSQGSINNTTNITKQTKQTKPPNDRSRKNSIDVNSVESFEKMKRDLRGKEYTYNHNGEIVFVQPVNFDKLPLNSVAVKVNVHGNDNAASGGSTSSKKNASGENERTTATGSGPVGRRGLGTSSRPRVSLGRKKQGNVAGEKTDHFISHGTAPQPLLVETMKVNAGVTLKEGSRVKSGPSKKEVPHLQKTAPSDSSRLQYSAIPRDLSKNHSTDVLHNSMTWMDGTKEKDGISFPVSLPPLDSKENLAGIRNKKQQNIRVNVPVDFL